MSKRLKIKYVREGGAAVLLVALVLLPLTLMVLSPDEGLGTLPKLPEQSPEQLARESPKPRPTFRPAVVVPQANHKRPPSFWRKPDPKRIAATHREVAKAHGLSSQALVVQIKRGDRRQQLVAINTLWVRGKRVEAARAAKGDPTLEAKIKILRQANR